MAGGAQSWKVNMGCLGFLPQVKGISWSACKQKNTMNRVAFQSTQEAIIAQACQRGPLARGNRASGWAKEHQLGLGVLGWGWGLDLSFCSMSEKQGHPIPLDSRWDTFSTKVRKEECRVLDARMWGRFVSQDLYTLCKPGDEVFFGEWEGNSEVRNLRVRKFEPSTVENGKRHNYALIHSLLLLHL